MFYECGGGGGGGGHSHKILLRTPESSCDGRILWKRLDGDSETFIMSSVCLSASVTDRDPSQA